MAELIKQELGVDTLLTKGSLGEFSIRVGDQVVARKSWLNFPSDQKVLASVKQALAV